MTASSPASAPVPPPGWIERIQSAGSEFISEGRALARAMPDKLFFILLLAPWALLFQFLGSSTFGYLKSDSLFHWMYFVFSTSPDDGHGLLIPWVVLALLWWKRKEFMAAPKGNWLPGAFWLLAALLLHLAGYMVQQNRISIVALFLGGYAIAGLVWGKTFLKVLFFPYFLFVFCVPLGTMADSLTFPLRMAVSVVTAVIGQRLLGIDVIRVGTQLFDGQQGFSYDVAAACSGIRSLTVLLALTTIYGFVTFRTGWKRLAMVAAAIPLAVIGNIARITGVVIVAEAFGQRAGMAFHDRAGFVTFLMALFGVLALGHFLREHTLDAPLRRAP